MLALRTLTHSLGSAIHLFGVMYIKVTGTILLKDMYIYFYFLNVLRVDGKQVMALQSTFSYCLTSYNA